MDLKASLNRSIATMAMVVSLSAVLVGRVAAVPSAGAEKPGEPEPKKMIKIVTALESNDTPPDAYAAKPKTLYLAGHSYMRSEEELDSTNNIQGLTIVSEPNVWMINLADGQARHIVDPGPSYDVHAPVLSGLPNLPGDLKDLEFGHEVRFFRSRHARRIGSRVIDGKSCEGVELTASQYRVSLYTEGKPAAPKRIEVQDASQALVLAVRYVDYRSLAFDRVLFSPPPGTTFKEQK